MSGSAISKTPYLPSSASVKAASLRALSPPSLSVKSFERTPFGVVRPDALPFVRVCVARVFAAFSSAICTSSLLAKTTKRLALRARSLALWSFAKRVKLVDSVSYGMAILRRSLSADDSTSSRPPRIWRRFSSSDETEPACIKRAEWWVLISDRSCLFRSSTAKDSFESAAETSPGPLLVRLKAL